MMGWVKKLFSNGVPPILLKGIVLKDGQKYPRVTVLFECFDWQPNTYLLVYSRDGFWHVQGSIEWDKVYRNNCTCDVQCGLVEAEWTNNPNVIPHEYKIIAVQAPYYSEPGAILSNIEKWPQSNILSVFRTD